MTSLFIILQPGYDEKLATYLSNEEIKLFSEECSIKDTPFIADVPGLIEKYQNLAKYGRSESVQRELMKVQSKMQVVKMQDAKGMAAVWAAIEEEVKKEYPLRYKVQSANSKLFLSEALLRVKSAIIWSNNKGEYDRVNISSLYTFTTLGGSAVENTRITNVLSEDMITLTSDATFPAGVCHEKDRADFAPEDSPTAAKAKLPCVDSVFRAYLDRARTAYGKTKVLVDKIDKMDLSS